MLYPYAGRASSRRYIKVGNVLFPKRGAVAIGDLILISSGAPCHQGHWGNTVVVTDAWNEYVHMREYRGVNGIGQMWNGRWEVARYRDLTTDVTGTCYAWQLRDAEKS